MLKTGEKPIPGIKLKRGQTDEHTPLTKKKLKKSTSQNGKS